MKITRRQLRKLIKEVVGLNEGAVSLDQAKASLSTLVSNVQTAIATGLTEYGSPEWGVNDPKRYVFKLKLGEDEYPYDVLGTEGKPINAPDEQKQYVVDIFNDEKEKEEYLPAFEALAGEYGSFKLPVSIRPPQYAASEDIVFTSTDEN
jgi:hypothetical protein